MGKKSTGVDAGVDKHIKIVLRFVPVFPEAAGRMFRESRRDRHIDQWVRGCLYRLPRLGEPGTNNRSN